MSKILAFIPARFNSKRLIKKNIKLFLGKPLIAWTIEAALNANVEMDVIVSTDSNEIADIAKKYGAEVPFLRAKELATDKASSFSALEDLIIKLSSLGRNYDYIVLLQPTSPLRGSVSIEEAFDLLIVNDANAVVSVTELEHPVEWAMELPVNNDMSSFIDKSICLLKKRSQDFPAKYLLNGAIYCGKTSIVLQEKTFYVRDKIYAYKMPKKNSIDIDDIDSFEYAEYLMLKNKV